MEKGDNEKLDKLTCFHDYKCNNILLPESEYLEHGRIDYILN